MNNYVLVRVSRLRNSILAIIAIAAVVASTSLLSAPSLAKSPPAGAALAQPDQAANQEVVFFDDFAGPELDRAVWNVAITRDSVYNNEQQVYVDAPETLYFVNGEESKGAENGALVLQAKHKPGLSVQGQDHKFDFTSARINTQGKMEFRYGTAAARMKLPPGSGLWPAFWALGNGNWPDCGEIDIMECVGEPDWTSVALHGPGYFGDTPLVAKHHFEKSADVSAWHVYSVDWTPQALVFRVDDKIVYQVKRADVEKHGPWRFDNQKYLILNLALGGTYPQGVNGARSPYPGLPESTVERIKAGDAKVLVDWVRVTRDRHEYGGP